MRQLDTPNVIYLPRTQYAIRTKQTRWQWIKAKFVQAAALASIAAVVAAVVFEYLTSVFPIPA